MNTCHWIKAKKKTIWKSFSAASHPGPCPDRNTLTEVFYWASPSAAHICLHQYPPSVWDKQSVPAPAPLWLFITGLTFRVELKILVKWWSVRHRMLLTLMMNLCSSAGGRTSGILKSVFVRYKVFQFLTWCQIIIIINIKVLFLCEYSESIILNSGVALKYMSVVQDPLRRVQLEW